MFLKKRNGGRVLPPFYYVLHTYARASMYMMIICCVAALSSFALQVRQQV